MLSRWVDQKPDVVRMRMEGKSIGNIEKSFGIPRSTLSGWFKNIQLTKNQKDQLTKNRLHGLIKARTKAVLWHNIQKENRLKEAEKQASNLLSNLDIKNLSLQELALAMLYLGEGIKGNRELGLGNSDPLVLKYVHADKRTLGSDTHPHYKGVCLIRCGNLSIQRKLVYIARKYCEQIIV